jgi:hypothetical protein
MLGNLWKNNMKMGLVHKEQKAVVDWIRLAQDRANDGMLSTGQKIRGSLQYKKCLLKKGFVR